MRKHRLDKSTTELIQQRAAAEGRRASVLFRSALLAGLRSTVAAAPADVGMQFVTGDHYGARLSPTPSRSRGRWRPDTVVIDEPDLGLPFVLLPKGLHAKIAILAEMEGRSIRGMTSQLVLRGLQSMTPRRARMPADERTNA